MNDDLEAKIALLEEHIDKLNKHSANLYEQGWNAGLEMAAFKLIHDFEHAFGKDTLASIAVWLKGLKK